MPEIGKFNKIQFFGKTQSLDRDIYTRDFATMVVLIRGCVLITFLVNIVKLVEFLDQAKVFAHLTNMYKCCSS